MSAIKRFKHEHEFHAEWWSVTLPSDWRAEETKVCWRFLREPMVGALHVSAAKNEQRLVTDEDLLEFASERVCPDADVKPVQYPAVTGFSAAAVKDDVFWREWWLRAGHLILHASYNADAGTEQSEASDAERIVASLRPEPHAVGPGQSSR